MARLTGTLHENQRTFLIISRSVLLRMRNVSDKSCKENQNTNIMFNNFFLNRAVYGIRWRNTVEPDSLQMTIRRTYIACCIPEATHTLTLCETSCFYTTTMVARTLSIVTLYLHCLPWYILPTSTHSMCMTSCTICLV
jgi:hypothetical protein